MTVKNLEYVIFLLVECDFYCIFAHDIYDKVVFL